MTLSHAELTAAFERERAQFLEQIAQIDEQHWYTVQRADGWSVHDIASHVADSVYGLGMLARGEGVALSMSDPQTGQMNPGSYNDERREKNATVPRAKIIERLGKAFDKAAESLAQTQELDTPVAEGVLFTPRAVFVRLLEHAAEHRAEIAEQQ